MADGPCPRCAAMIPRGKEQVMCHVLDPEGLNRKMQSRFFEDKPMLEKKSPKRVPRRGAGCDMQAGSSSRNVVVAVSQCCVVVLR